MLGKSPSALLVFAAWLHGGGTLPEHLTCRVTPPVIEVGAFYDGANVKIEGLAAPRSQVIVTISGSDREERFNRKARFGPIWVTAGSVRISGTPSLFLRFSPVPVAAMLDGQSIALRNLDEASWAARMRINPHASNDAALRSGYLELKKSDGTFSLAEGSVVMGQSEDCATYALQFRWPKKAPPAQYQVHVYEVRDGAITRETSTALSVVRIGFPAWLAGLAEKRASLYGVAAVLIGALAGFGIDFLTTLLFGKKRSTAH